MKLQAGLALAIVAGGLCEAGTARASGFAAARFGGELGSVVARNPTALYYNPAGIAFSTGTSIYADGTLAIRRATWDHTATQFETADPVGGEGSNAGKAELFNVFGGPMAGVTTRIGDLAIGASFEVPFGGRAFWGTNDRFKNGPYPLAADGVQRWHIIEGAITFIYATVGAAYRLGPLSIGVSGNLIFGQVKNSQAKSFGAEPYPDTSSEGRNEINVSGTHGSFAVGAMAEVLPDTLWIGASYQAQPGLGQMKMKGTLTLSYQGGSVETPVDFYHALPDIVRLGARYKVNETLELRLFGDLTRWSVLQTQCLAREGHACAVFPNGSDATGDSGVLQNVRRNMKDTVGVHVGASYWTSPTVELYAGLALETAAVPDETLRPDLPDSTNIAPAAGARLQVARSFFLGASYTHIQYLNRDNTGKSQLSQAATPTLWADGGGKYTQFIGVFNANVEKQF